MVPPYGSLSVGNEAMLLNTHSSHISLQDGLGYNHCDQLKWGQHQLLSTEQLLLAGQSTLPNEVGSETYEKGPIMYEFQNSINVV